MKKTLTTYEALQANETKRVRSTGVRGGWHEVGGLIDLLNRGFLDHRNFLEWEAEEPLIERWAIYWQDIYQCCFPNENEAVQFLKDGSERIVHLREVRT